MPARPKSNQRNPAKTFPQRSLVFAEYKRRTGAWPVLSMALYFGRFVLMLAGISFLFWYGRNHSETQVRTTIYFVLITLPVALAWSVAESVAWNRDLRSKGLIPPRTILGVRQFPPE